MRASIPQKILPYNSLSHLWGPAKSSPENNELFKQKTMSMCVCIIRYQDL